jgi:hypothetical protein
MKKFVVLLFGLLLVSGLHASGSEMGFGINFGTMTDDSFSFSPFMWTAGAELDLHFGSYFMFSPEALLVGNGFKFKEFLLFPGAIVNFTPGNFFVGGGITKGFYIGSGTSFAVTDVALKLNAGLISKNLKLTAYLITAFDDLFSHMLVGANIGFMF